MTVRLILTALLCLVNILCHAQVTDMPVYNDIMSESENSQEWQIAMDFLNSKGVTPSALGQTIALETLVVFTDKRAQAYAVVVRKDYQPYIDKPVLAWGVGDLLLKSAGVLQYNDDNHLLGLYDDLLQQYKGKHIVYKSPVKNALWNHPDGVAPLLGDIKYGQEAPYNKKFPMQASNGKLVPCVVGCGPVALAQVLAYYHSATRPTGTASIHSGAGYVYKVNLSNYEFSWSGGENELANLMVCSAASVNATVTPEGSSSGLAIFKQALLNHWHYSPKCTYMRKRSDMELLTSVYSEIDRQRPVIVADSTHMYVCDGYYQDYIHLNLGWDGYGNGYYRAIISDSGEDDLLPFNEIMTGLKPLEQSDMVVLDIKFDHPGQLGRILTAEQRETVTTLRVSGYLNGDDLAIIRQMAGAAPSPDKSMEHGSLMDLDISGATIVKGGCYVTRSANKMVVSGSITSGKQKVKYSYDLSNLKPGQWKEMQDRGLTNKPARVIRADGKGNYTVSWHATDSTIGPYMFDGCDNLCRIVLPRNIKSVKENAFFGCISLDRVEGLPSDVSPKAFNNSKFNLPTSQ